MKIVTMFSFVLAMGLFDVFAPLPLPAAAPEATRTPEWGGAYLVFAGKFGGEVTTDQLQEQRELGVEGCARGSRIFTFTLEVTRAGKTTAFSSRSNVLSDDMRAALRALRAGDTFEFKRIRAYLPNGKDAVDVHSRTFVVV